METIAVPQNIIGGMVIFTDRKIDRMEPDEIGPIVDLPFLLSNLAGFAFSREQAAEIRANCKLAPYRRGIESVVSISPTDSLELTIEISKSFEPLKPQEFTFTVDHRVSAKGDVNLIRQFNAVFQIEGFGIKRSGLYISEMQFDPRRQKIHSNKVISLNQHNIIDRVVGIRDGKKLLGTSVSTDKLVAFVSRH
jgi:hypothetical protein